MDMTLPDLIDRLSILSLKCERLPYDQATFDEMIKYAKNLAYDTYNSERRAVAIFYRQKLWTVNGQIWDLEADIRKGKEGELGLEEVGRRALAIRDLNKERIAIKNELAEKVGEYQEVKGDHASA